MHYFFMTRGIKRDVDELIKFLETAPVLLPMIDKDGKECYQPTHSMLQPIQLWSMVIPEGLLPNVLGSLGGSEENQKRWINNKKMKLLTEAMRLGMGAEKIPSDYAKGKTLYVPLDAMQNISIIPIGIKRDSYMWHPDGFYHESL